jgi:NAD(P)-dependent dehydrogenase (short-subunit alcohol dehydrogenase family)
MSVSFDFTDRVALVTGASGALGSAAATAFRDAGATVAAVDVVVPGNEDAQLDANEGIAFYEADLTDETEVERVVDDVIDDQGRLDHLLNVAGTWRGGTPIHETDESTFDLLFDVNLRTAFLTSKHALPYLHDREGSIVSVSARSSLSGGEGDGLYRAAKAGIRLLTETLAEENEGAVRANAVMPSVIDTPANREAMPDANHEKWVDPAEIADVMLFLCSDATGVTSGAAVPVYGEA